MVRTLALCLAASSLLVLGCAKKPVVPEPIETTAARVPRGTLRPSDELVKICKLTFGNVERAPKFNFDDSELLPEDRDVLVQIARCVTSGPLKGRALALVGRADPRGETEYNMVLGEHRADSVYGYLALLGVASDHMAKTSRGELDAEGNDEDTWQRDRRVDVTLMQVQRTATSELVGSPAPETRTALVE
jgi:peptidoglycan-associated lipoprotein